MLLLLLVQLNKLSDSTDTIMVILANTIMVILAIMDITVLMAMALVLIMETVDCTATTMVMLLITLLPAQTELVLQLDQTIR